MAAEVLNELISRNVSPEDLIAWLTTENLVHFPAGLNCSKEDFIPYFLNFLREQTSSILQLNSCPTPSKTQKILQEGKESSRSNVTGSRKSRLELFPAEVDIGVGIKTLEIDNVNSSFSKVEDRCRNVTKVMSPGGGCGRPLAQSSPLQDVDRRFSADASQAELPHRRRRDSDTLQRSFNLQDFIVKDHGKGTRHGRKKIVGVQEKTDDNGASLHDFKEGKSRKRINPTRLGPTARPRGGDVCFGLVSRSCEPSAPFCGQPIEKTNCRNFEEERTLLRKERLRHRSDHKQTTLSPAKMVASCVDFVVAEPQLVDCPEQLQVLAEVYCCLLNFNLVLNIMTELCFVVGLLTVHVPVAFRTEKLGLQHDENLNASHSDGNSKQPEFFNTVHNCVYFAVSVLNQQRQLLEFFDKITLKMLGDNKLVLSFAPELHNFIGSLLVADTSKSRRYVKTVPIQGNVSFQSDTDNRQNFPNDQAFHVFRKQRDGLYEIIRTWEANHLLSGWSFAIALGPRIRTLLGLHDEPANFVHFARLFRSQLLGTCSGHSKCSEPTLFNDSSGSLDVLKEVHPEKLSRLHERLVTPIQSGGPCPLPSFPGQQEFYRDFILYSSHPAFLQHLSDSLASEILVLNDTSFTASDLEDTDTSVDDATCTNYLTCVSALRLLAKFLGFIVFLPYQSKAKVLPESILMSHSALRAKLCPRLDILTCVNEAARIHKLVLTLPWVVQYFAMMDAISIHLPYYRAVFKKLFEIYRDARLPGRPTLLIRLLLGWLFESPNFPGELFYAWKPNSDSDETLESGAHCLKAAGDLSWREPLDALDVVDEHCLYLCCPYMGELKLGLSTGMGSSGRAAKHITPISASLNQPSAARQMELQLEESFFHGQAASTRKTVEYISERVASCCMKHICSKVLPDMKRQGAADVAQLLSALSTETGTKQLKESLLRDVTVVAERCCGEFRLHCDVGQYCRHKCGLALPVLLADDVLESVCTMSAQIAARLSQERVHTWIQSHITPGLFMKEFQLDVDRAFRNAGKIDHKNESICKSSHVVPPGGRSVKHQDTVQSPTRVIMRVRELSWQLLDGSGLTELQVLAALEAVKETLCGRADLIPSAENLLPCMVLDLALLLVVHRPDMLTVELMEYFVTVWHASAGCESLTRLLCARNVLLLSQSTQPAHKVWKCLAGLLAHLVSSGMLQPDALEQQFLALLQSAWPQTVLSLIALCIREVVQRCGNSRDCHFTLLLEWLSEMCDEMGFLN